MSKKKPVRIPGFKAIALLGKGAQGVVFKGVEEASKKPVAIKVLSPKWAKIPEFKARFLRESTTARSLSHPHIVKGLKAGEAGGLLYFIMEFAGGKPLSDLVTKSRPLAEALVIRLGIQAADALAYAHKNNLIHRDIKPSNFMVSKEGNLKLLDLGLAKETDSEKDLTVAGSVFGTPNYISPEAVHDSKAVDNRSDIYSLGATLYELATGRPPFEGINAVLIMEQVCKKAPERPSAVNPKISVGLEAVILKTLAKAPAARYSDAEKMKADLQRVQAGRTPLAETPGKRGARPPVTRRGPSGRGPRASSRRSPARKGLFSRALGWLGLGRT